MIFRSPLPDVAIPTATLADYALANVDAHASRAAFIDASSERVVTHGELRAQVTRAAAGLAARGVTKGDVVAISLPNLPEFAVALYAVTSLGAIATTLNPLYTSDEVDKQLRDAGARYLITLPLLLEPLRPMLPRAALREIFVLGEADGATPWRELFAGDATPPTVSIDPARDLAVLPYSSGTTGLPKGVMLTHRALVANAEAGVHGPNRISGDDVFVGVPPMFHIYGITFYFGLAMRLGGTVVCLPRFDFAQYVAALARYRATFAVVVPPVALGLAQHPLVAEHDLSALRYIVSSAAPLAPALAEAMQKRLGVRVVQGYGMTEIAGASHVQREDDPAGSVGVALPNVEWRVMDPDGGAELDAGQHGEIWVRGPSLMTGYLNQPDATRATLDDEGWLHTGDIGYGDADARCFIVDRLKELIKFKGYQVAPAELEAVLLSHPAVADAGVIPMPDAESGEVPKAFVVKRGEVDAETLKAYVAARVAPYKKLREVVFVESLPKSPAGKLLRRMLKA
ncbi:MAG: AMP-binding protein [Gammaproteobacteria bacterium]